jgi:hypothetical protein
MNIKRLVIFLLLLPVVFASSLVYATNPTNVINVNGTNYNLTYITTTYDANPGIFNISHMHGSAIKVWPLHLLSRQGMD